MKWRVWLVAVALPLVTPLALQAAVVLDGSLGAKGPLTGPHFSLDAGMGKRVGSNLFYSFSDFSLVKGDVATFSSHVPVRNVLARVTGGNASNIDGKLQVTIPNASFYLINPAGVIFGPDSAIDVKGSFVVTTANELKLADGGHFDAHLPDTSLLTTAAPAAFGFLGQPAAISMNGAVLAPPTGVRVIMAGGDFTATNSFILAPSGHISISSTAAADDVVIGSDLEPASPAQGKVSLTNTGFITDGLAGSRIDIHAGDLTMQTSLISTDTVGTLPNRGIGLFLSGNLVADNSTIDDSTTATANAGSISISAADASIDNTSIESQSRATGSGGATGDVNINAASLHMRGGAGIDIGTSGTGKGGTIRINAGTVVLDGTGASPQAIDSIDASTSSTAPNAGHGGNIVVTATSLRVVDGFAIECAVFGSGSGGDVSVHAKSLLINENLAANNTDIASDARSSATGHSGDVTVVADAIDLIAGGRITSNTAGLGSGGDVFVTANNLNINGGGLGGFTGISSESLSGAQGGPSGQVQVKAGNIQISNEGEIESDSDGLGAAGDVSIKTTTLHIDGANSEVFFTGVSSDSDSETQGGNAGDVNITAKTIQLVHGGQISSTTEGTGDGGDINISANSFAAKGDASGIFADSDSSGGSGNAGVIHLNANSLEIDNFGQVETDTSGLGAAGDIVVQANSLRIDGGTSPAFTGISSESDNEGPGGKAGNVSINCDNLLIDHGGQILSDTASSGAGGNISVTASNSISIDGQSLVENNPTGIDASSGASATGDAGSVKVQAPNLQLVRGGAIITDAFGDGAGGSVKVRANSLTIDAQNSTAFTGISANADPLSTGRAGDIVVNASTASLIGGGNIRSDTFGQGLGGSIDVVTTSLTLDNENITVPTMDASTEKGASGAAGNIIVKSNRLRIVKGADIQADTFGQGNGGSVSVDAGSLSVDAEGSKIFTGISASADSGATGSAGAIDITGANNSIQVVNGGEITSTTEGTGAAGSIRISAADFTADGATGLRATGVFVQSHDTDAEGGNAGAIVVHANSVSLARGALLSTSTEGGGSAGQIQVFAEDFAATGSDIFGRSGAFSQSLNAQLAAAGSAGDVIVHASSLDLDDGAALSALTAGSGHGGNITLFADSLRFSGNSSMDATSTGSGRAGDLQFHVGKMDLENMIVQTLSTRTNGGNITIHAAQRVSLYNSALATSAHGNGGNITIDPLAVALNHSAVLANAFQGNGGNITIASQAFVQSPDSIVNASSQLGLAGNIAISSPNADVVQGLARLNESLGQQIGLQETCAQRFSLSDFSSFVVEGSGGLPLEPGQSEMSFTIHGPTTQPAKNP